MTLLAILLSWSVGRMAGREVEAAIGEELAEVAFNMGDKFDRGMFSRAAEIDLLAEMEALTDPADPIHIRALLDRIQAAVPQFTWMGYLSPDGTVLAATGGVIEGSNVAHRPVFSQGIKGLYVGDVHEATMLAKALPSNPNGEPLRFVDLSRPIQGEDGVSGILAAHLGWGWAREIQDSLIGPLRDRRNVEMFIVDRENRVLLAPLGSPLTSNPSGQPAQLPAVFSGGPDGPKEGWGIHVWPNGTRYLTGYAREQGYKSYPGLGWTVICRSPVSEALAPVGTLKLLTFNIGIATAIVFAFLAWLVAGRVTRPLRSITRAADGLRHGAIGANLPYVGGSREIEYLSGSLRALVDTLTATNNQRAKMETMALKDILTNLPNRTALRAHLDGLSGTKVLDGQAVAFLYMDLDGFKRVNDSLGHEAGDAVLRHCASRLIACLREGDLAVRMGGDEFVLLVHATPESWREVADAVAARVIAAITAPIPLDDGAVARVGTSIGIAAWPLDGESYGDVMHRADQTLYAVKRAGKGQAWFWVDLAHHTERT
ncbi:MAG: sensor domain-containing diguanylate cyclase [Rhodospirillum sp.]|nr:sensor domain-containing diguanylate cyclase [Rhodospirillum sp.]MCF8489379.1 sensor domain-containing diguanylate cyclase [Rhodospirillum sp.]